MASNLFASEVFRIIEKSLDAAWLQHAVLANNVSNVNTPYFKRSEVAFRDELAAALTQRAAPPLPMGLSVTHALHVQVDAARPGPASVEGVLPRILVREDTTLRNDGNNVDVDVEMAKLAENSILYNAFAQLAGMKLAGLKSVISEGRR